MTRRRVATALCAAALTACSSQPTQPTPSPTAAPSAQAGVTTTALLISALDTATRLFGSDGKTHLEYDLTLQKHVQRARHGDLDRSSRTRLAQSLLKLDGMKVAKFTTPAFTGPPTAVVPASGALGTVIDVVVAAGQCARRSRPTEISYRPAGSSERSGQ